jgi:hypothetical protein
VLAISAFFTRWRWLKAAQIRHCVITTSPIEYSLNHQSTTKAPSPHGRGGHECKGWSHAAGGHVPSSPSTKTCLETNIDSSRRVVATSRAVPAMLASTRTDRYDQMSRPLPTTTSSGSGITGLKGGGGGGGARCANADRTPPQWNRYRQN